MLFGGRPKRAAHDEEPTSLIDVYTPEGRYIESYRLPFGAVGFTTDGSRFFVVRQEPFPALVGLRPRRE
jgi:hypothetical protein